MEDLSAKFPNAIRFYKYFHVKESYKARDFKELFWLINYFNNL
jgi:hypothetical protein